MNTTFEDEAAEPRHRWRRRSAVVVCALGFAFLAGGAEAALAADPPKLPHGGHGTDQGPDGIRSPIERNLDYLWEVDPALAEELYDNLLDGTKPPKLDNTAAPVVLAAANTADDNGIEDKLAEIIADLTRSEDPDGWDSRYGDGSGK